MDLSLRQIGILYHCQNAHAIAPTRKGKSTTLCSVIEAAPVLAEAEAAVPVTVPYPNPQLAHISKSMQVPRGTYRWSSHSRSSLSYRRRCTNSDRTSSRNSSRTSSGRRSNSTRSSRRSTGSRIVVTCLGCWLDIISIVLPNAICKSAV
jgi:hypothetical protein